MQQNHPQLLVHRQAIAPDVLTHSRFDLSPQEEFQPLLELPVLGQSCPGAVTESCSEGAQGTHQTPQGAQEMKPGFAEVGLMKRLHSAVSERPFPPPHVSPVDTDHSQQSGRRDFGFLPTVSNGLCQERSV